MPNDALPKVCNIGAGCLGFTTAKRLKGLGVPFDCFEMSDGVGGNWYYKNPNGLSACYASLHIDTSKWRLAFEDFAVPSDWPDFPHHGQLSAYFNAYVDHFGLRPMITFNARVETARRDPQGFWRVDNLIFMELAQPLPTLVNFAEQQAKLVGAYLTGRYRPPAPAEMQAVIVKDEAMYLGGYYASLPHTIQVDFNTYVHDLKQEIAKGGKRAQAARCILPVPARAAETALEPV